MNTRKSISLLSCGILALVLSAGVAQAWHVSGKVVCDANQNGQFDATDTALQGLIITVRNSGGTQWSAMTDANGAFSIELPHVNDSYTTFVHPQSVPPGATLLVPAEGYYSFSLTNENQFFEEAYFVFNCSTASPPAGDCGKVTGGGWIDGTPSGEKANFGVSGGPDGWGHLNYIDHGTGLHVRSTAVTAYETDPTDADGRIIRYNVVVGSASLTAIVRVIDRGEPGTHDWFEISLSTGYHAAGELGGARPGGGNIQLHKCPPGKAKK